MVDVTPFGIGMGGRIGQHRLNLGAAFGGDGFDPGLAQPLGRPFGHQLGATAGQVADHATWVDDQSQIGGSGDDGGGGRRVQVAKGLPRRAKKPGMWISTPNARYPRQPDLMRSRSRLPQVYIAPTRRRDRINVKNSARQENLTP